MFGAENELHQQISDLTEMLSQINQIVKYTSENVVVEAMREQIRKAMKGEDITTLRPEQEEHRLVLKHHKVNDANDELAGGFGMVPSSPAYVCRFSISENLRLVRVEAIVNLKSKEERS